VQRKNEIIFSSNSAAAPSSSQAPARTKGKLLLFLLLLVLIAGSFIAAASGLFIFRLYQSLPTFSQMQNIEQPLVSRVLGNNGAPLHEFSIERRFWVTIDTIPEQLQQAVIAIEDRRFYKHWGIDMRRIAGAIVVDVIRGKYAQGASTITQQLARNVYLTSKASMIRKIREALTAIQLESCYTKREILELYLNQVYLGAGVYGVQAASEHFFSKPVWELNTAECAVIAGMIQLPERYRPDKPQNIKRITTRRNTVLRAMREMGMIDRAVLQETTTGDVIANPRVQKSPIGPYFIEMVRKHVADKYGDDMLYNGGLTIYTTLDPIAQDTAERSTAREIRSLQRRLNRIFLDSTRVDRKYRIPRDTFMAHFDSIYALHQEEFEAFPDSIGLRQAQVAMVALDVQTGAIRSLIGGRNFEESKFNRAVQAIRQPGSAIKPIVYTAAMEHGFTPASVVLDQPITLMTPTGEWRPENYDKVFSGPVTIRSALAKSINLVAIQVLNKVGPDTVVMYARRMGFRHTMEAIPALAIGACQVTPMEITSAYSIYPNHGIRAKPYFIEKVVDKNGRVLESHMPEEEEVLSPQTSFLMASLMRTVVCCGTAASIPGLGFTRPASGKTGTSNDYSDAWFIGYTPQLVCGVWTGVDERRSLGRGVTGSLAAIPIWVRAMLALHRGMPVKDFDRPEGIKTENICSESHLTAVKNCPKAGLEFFLEDAVVDTCDIHGPGKSRRGSIINMFGTQPNKQKPDEKRKKKNQLMF
jgi:penicillin-binding protein 1A